MKKEEIIYSMKKHSEFLNPELSVQEKKLK